MSGSNDPDFKGCLFINAASEFPNPNDPAHHAAASHKQQTRDLIRNMAGQAGAKDPESFADVYTVLFEGTLVLRQVHDRDDAARTARPIIERLIEEHISAS